MKTRACAWAMSLGLNLICPGQDAEAYKRFEEAFTKSEEKAIAAFPDAANFESPLAKKMKEIDDRVKAGGDPLYNSPDKPYLIAVKAAEELGIAPVIPNPLPTSSPLRDGKVIPEFNGYNQVMIRKVEPDGISIIHESGATKIPIERLTPALRDAFGLSAAGAAEYRRQQADAVASIRAREQEESAQREKEPSKQPNSSDGAQSKRRAVSDALAKTAAYEAWISQGGGILDWPAPQHRDEYRRGPMKGMTVEEARQKFEQMWQTAGPEVREKYRRRKESVWEMYVTNSDAVKHNRENVALEIERTQGKEAAARFRQQVEAEKLAARNAAAKREDKAIPPSAMFQRTGDRITINGNLSGGYNVRENQLLDHATGMPTHNRSAGYWVPMDKSHPTIYDP